MRVNTEQEALYIACEMEASAVELYTRAIKLMEQLGREKEPLYIQLELMLSDEREHLRQFRALYAGLDTSEEKRLMLSAVAEGLLFEGGLMGAAREGLLKNPEAMLRFAMDAEAASAKKYREFALLAEDEHARAALQMIAAEEDQHLLELKEQSGNSAQ